MIYGHIALLAVQLLAVLLCGVAYLRTMARRDAFDSACSRIAVAEKTADAALKVVQAMENEHFKALLNKYELLSSEDKARARAVKDIEGEMQSLKMGVLALQKWKKKEATEVAPEAPPEPLYTEPPPVARNGYPSNFGKKAG